MRSKFRGAQKKKIPFENNNKKEIKLQLIQKKIHKSSEYFI